MVTEKIIKRVSEDTGEVIEETQEKTYVVDKNSEPFFLTYSKALSVLYNIQTAAAIKVLWKLLDLCNFNKGTVAVSPINRSNICKDLGISGPTYYAAISSLKDLGIIEGKGGFFAINPDVMWKGDTATRDKLMKSGCKITIGPNKEFSIG
jgi:hypothetical protein